MTASIDPNVIYSQNGPVFALQMHRPEKKNALTQTMYRALAEGLRYADAEASIKVIVIQGTAECFTSGNDVNDFVVTTDGQSERPSVQFMKAICHARKPVIAAVNGLAIGIGTTMLLHCDLVYVSDEARLAMPFVSLGLVPEYASSLLIPALLGHVKAAEKLMLGEPFSGSDAVDCGIANAVLPAGEVVNHARRMAERFNALPPSAVRETKRLMRAPQRAQVLQVMQAEGELFAQRLRSPEAMEAFQAFFQKRKPDFSKF